MRAIVTGQVGVDKKHYLSAVADLAGQRGGRIDLHHVGDRMYAEAPDIRPGRILDLPLSRLHALRRSVFKDIIAESADQPNVIVNTHATFRWRHGLFRAFDFDQIQQFKPDLFICLIDNAEAVFHRLHAEHSLDATLKDIMVWREEEILATELLAQAMSPMQSPGITIKESPGMAMPGLGPGLSSPGLYILSRGRDQLTVETCCRLVCQPQMRKVYPSFPMSHVVDMPDVLAEINAFRAQLAKHFITFDPGDVDEKLLLDKAIAAAREGHDFIQTIMLDSAGKPQTANVPVKQVLDCAGDIDGQIYARDFKLIDQSDMIVSLVPELPGGAPGSGIPGLSSGVERELQHAYEASKDVYVVWKPKKNPSPFITETATKVFKSVPEALTYFESAGLFNQTTLFGH